MVESLSQDPRAFSSSSGVSQTLVSAVSANPGAATAGGTVGRITDFSEVAIETGVLGGDFDSADPLDCARPRRSSSDVLGVKVPSIDSDSDPVAT